jgi:hypothetical protein
MKATVIRNGQHSGGALFVEVQETPSSPCYAVPVSAELPLGTVVDINVKVAEVPKAPEADLTGTDVSVADAPVAVVEESPLVAEEPVVEEEPVDKKKGKGK